MPNHIVHRSELRPLPMRITQLQFERLTQLRADDGIAIQEHVRRALDMYLADRDQKARKVELELAEVEAHGVPRLTRLRSQYRVNRR